MPAFTLPEIDFWLNPASIDTGSADRDTHLKSANVGPVDPFDISNDVMIKADGEFIKE